MDKVTIFWFRRDFRLFDNAGLHYALKDEFPVQPIFIFDTEILDELEDKKDARVEFIHQEIDRLNKELKDHESSIDVRIGKPLEVWKDLLEDYNIGRVYANKDYEPYTRERDKAIYDLLEENGIKFIGKKDQVIFEKNEVLKEDGDPYVVYTPYSKVWKNNLSDFYLKSYPSEEIPNWNKVAHEMPSLKKVGFEPAGIAFPDRKADDDIIQNYHKTRNIPGIDGTTRLSLHLRFGTISVRELTRKAMDLNHKYFNELIWREFYMSILWHYPQIVDNNFKKKYDTVEWRNNEEEFEKWCNGKTGFPIVDAGMRELNETGYMHNRVRMITASFLTKDLLIDWRWGEAYFAKKLLDYELASNNGGWQWAAGTGVDAAPYFRIFNPTSQQEKFDPKFKYIKKWVPEFETDEYVKPIVDHKMARERTLGVYKEALS
ncbi:MAG: deoxyribodipyrimidine photo-lyase [Cyclobacteriaceae bacterium]